MTTTATSPRKFTLFCPFGGGGGGAKGGQDAKATLFGSAATVELLGGIDNVQRVCEDFEYLTGVPQTCADVSEMTTDDMRRVVGPVAPYIAFGSPPCKASSGLLPAKRAREPKYQAMSRLALVLTRLLLDTWEEPPALIIYENVPNITSRASAMLTEIRSLLRARGYALQDGFHDCGDVGGLGQRRKRWFMVARYEKKVPFFLYKPPHRGVKACGAVLQHLPMPCDPAGGPMHVMPNISALNWARLWAIPAGGDWRDLLKDGRPRQSRFRRQHVERWTDPSVPVVGPGSNGPYGVQEPRHHAPPFEATGYLVQLGDDGKAIPPPATAFAGAWGVLHPEETSGAVTGEAYPSNGRFSIADDRSVSAMRVAVSLVPQAGNANMHDGKYVVLDPSEPARTITGATRIGSGAPSVADASLLLPKKPAFDKAYGVLDPTQPSRTIAGTADVGCGAYSIADAIPLGCHPRAGAYGVLDPNHPSKTVVGAMKVDNSPAAIASPNLPPGYGVLPASEAAKIVSGEVRAPFAVYDRRFPGGPPAAIVDRLDRSPYKFIEIEPKKKGGKVKLKKVNVPLVMISEDGTWHRPLTTLELAALQSLPWMHGGKPLCFKGGSTEQREVIGNMVPPKAAQAIIEQMLLCLLAAEMGCFYLDSGGAGVWCRPEDRERLARAGIEIVHASKLWNIGGARVLDDGAVVPGKKRSAPRRLRPSGQNTQLQEATM